MLTVSATPRPTTEVPAVVGLAESAASEALDHAGFQIEAVVHAEPDAEQAAARPDVVWKQSPSAPGPADRGSTVTIWVNPA